MLGGWIRQSLFLKVVTKALDHLKIVFGDQIGLSDEDIIVALSDGHSLVNIIKIEKEGCSMVLLKGYLAFRSLTE
ncbi:unnamed protein product [Cuscuta campestris]|uniref:Uncharacterized protein n=1 Tax=Cuscuta campestris TaxID=132261 RepID=A0A484KIQ8_9ASTE|nr:unnamed protein product [Cuscuta campestris]